ncbi:MAG: hypothetical protein ABI629_04310 [bacterium]
MTAALLLLLPTQILAVGGAIDTYVGGGNGDGAAADDASIDARGIALAGSASSPDLYVADGKNNRIRRVDGQTGLIETVAGSGISGYGGDGGNALNARLSGPLDVARDSAGNLYIADTSNNRIRKVTPNGQISTFAGNGQSSYSGDNGLANNAALNDPYGVAVGPDGYVYLADHNNNRIRKVGPPGCGPTSCVITTVVGGNTYGFGGDNGPAANALLWAPADVAFDLAGNMLIADFGNYRIRKVVNGIITTVAGGGYYGIPFQVGDGGPATRGKLYYPTQVAVDAAGDLYIADSQNYRVRKVDAATQIITTVAGTGIGGATGDGGPAVEATLYPPWGIAAWNSGEYWISASNGAARSRDNRVRHVVNGHIDSVIDGGLGEGGAAYDALVDPRGVVAVPGSGAIPDIYFADGVNHVVRRVDGETGTLHTLAGTGDVGYSGDGGAAVYARLSFPSDVAVDGAGNVYVSDGSSNVVRKINPNGVISTVAGDGTNGNGGDGGLATHAQLSSPQGIDVDRNGNLYIADIANNRVRLVSNGVITTVAGTGQSAYSGDGGPATAAMLRFPSDVVVGSDGFYISDTSNHRIRYVNAAGIISTYAGLGYSGFAGDGGAAKDSLMYSPTFLSLDGAGRLFIADTVNKRIRMIEPGTRTISTVAGNGSAGAFGDGGPATSASFSDPSGVAIDPSTQALFISSKSDARIRIVDFDLGHVPPATATPTRTKIPSTPTRTPTFAQTPTRTATGGGQSAAVAGRIRFYATGAGVPSALVYFIGTLPTAVQTNSQGDYSASLAAGTWTLGPAKTGGVGNAVSSLDAARVLQMVAGLTTFNAQQRLACDTTGDGSVSTLDAVRILQFASGVITRFPAASACGSDWLFSPNPAQVPNQDVTPAALSGGICQQGTITLRSLATSVGSQDFTAIPFGDCTGNWSAGGAAGLSQTATSRSVIAGPVRHARGNVVRVPIYVHGAGMFQAMDLRLRFDAAAQFLAVRPIGGAAGALVSQHSSDGSVTVSVASGTPIDPADGAVLMLELHTDDAEALAVSLVSAMIDEQPARPVTESR